MSLTCPECKAYPCKSITHLDGSPGYEYVTTAGLLTNAWNAINKACAIIEMGDQRLLASDGPAGGQPPDLTLDEWRELYSILDNARKSA